MRTCLRVAGADHSDLVTGRRQPRGKVRDNEFRTPTT